MDSGKIGPQILMIQQYELEFSLHLYQLVLVNLLTVSDR